MKKITAYTSLAIILICSAVAAASPTYVYVNVNSSRLRSGPGTQNESLKVVSNGYKMKILSETELWYEVGLTDNEKGWILKRNVTYETPQTKKINKLQKSLEQEIAKKQKLAVELKKQITSMSYQAKSIDSFKRAIIQLKAHAAALEETQLLIVMVGGVLLLLLGWILGFITGGYRKKANEREYLEMMLEAHPSTTNLLKKTKAAIR